VVGISYDVKIDSFIRDIGSDSCIDAADLSSEKLIALIDSRLAAGDKDAMEKRETLKTLERKNGEAAAKLLAASGYRKETA